MTEADKAEARNREARIAQLAKEVFLRNGRLEAVAFEEAERFDDMAQRRWKELCK